MARAKSKWKTSAIYPMGRAAEFTIAACKAFPEEEAKILEYVVEAEHQDGAEYWYQFDTLADALDDFALFVKNYVS